MTPAEKAIMTRKKHKEAQDKKRAEALRSREAIRKGCLEILEADDVAPKQKLEAVKILFELEERGSKL